RRPPRPHRHTASRRRPAVPDRTGSRCGCSRPRTAQVSTARRRVRTVHGEGGEAEVICPLCEFADRILLHASFAFPLPGT
uniref:hypothetical protein n=1 Tax=Streptomyces acidiscabies TaxID=42234 RepID=UPI001C4B887C